MKAITEIEKLLDSPIPRHVISKRQGGGGVSLDYLEGWYVIDRQNKAFGHLGWEKDVEVLEKEKELTKDKYDKDIYTYTVAVKVGLNIFISGNDNESRYTKLTCRKEDIGICSGTSRRGFGEAMEMAFKGAVTDGLKRCAKDLGMSMGLALYDKSQSFVTDEEVTENKTTANDISLEPKKETRPIFKWDTLKTKEQYLKYLRMFVERVKSYKTTDVVANLKKEFKFEGRLDTLDLDKLREVTIYAHTAYESKPIYENEMEA